EQKAKNERHTTRYALRVLGLRTRAPKSSSKVSAVLARVDSEVPSNRSKRARSTSPVSVCESSGVIGALGNRCEDHLVPADPLLFPQSGDVIFRLVLLKGLFLRGQDAEE